MLYGQNGGGPRRRRSALIAAMLPLAASAAQPLPDQAGQPPLGGAPDRPAPTPMGGSPDRGPGVAGGMIGPTPAATVAQPFDRRPYGPRIAGMMPKRRYPRLGGPVA